MLPQCSLHIHNALLGLCTNIRILRRCRYRVRYGMPGYHSLVPTLCIIYDLLLSHCPHERGHETLYDKLLAGKPVLWLRTVLKFSPIAGTMGRGIGPSTEGTLTMSVGRQLQTSLGSLRRLRGSRAYRTYVRMTVSAH